MPPHERLQDMRYYLDYNATTPVHPQVEKTLKKALRTWGNPSSLHQEGRLAFDTIATARDQAATAIGGDPQEIVFTSSGSEANTWLIHHIHHQAYTTQTPAHVLISAVEHPCLRRACEAYAGPWLSYDTLPVDSAGRVSPKDILSRCTPHTRLVSVMLANNELGTLQPIREIANALQGTGILFHTDATQAPGKHPIDVRTLGVDFLTLSSHKVYAPKGTGLLYIRQGLSITPLIYGGAQEARRRAGTENTLGIAAFGAALAWATTETDTLTSDCKAAGAIFSTLENIPGFCKNSPSDHVLCNTLNCRFEGIPGQALAMRLDMSGVAISTGAACSTGAIAPSHVLLAMGQTKEQASEAIRISWGWGITPDIATKAVQLIREAVSGIRSSI